MTVSAQGEVLECPNCGGEMKLENTYEKTGIPLIPTDAEVGEFLCKDCGQGRRYERSGPADEWS